VRKAIYSILYGAALTAIGIAVLLVGGYWLLVYFAPMSEIKDRSDVESPDHRYVATGYHIIGGATVSDSTIIVVHEKGQSYADRTNEPVLIADNLEPFSMKWESSRSLVVKCSLSNTYSKLTSWKDLTVEYSEK
jgi:hypothetical protein